MHVLARLFMSFMFGLGVTESHQNEAMWLLYPKQGCQINWTCQSRRDCDRFYSKETREIVPYFGVLMMSRARFGN